MKNKLRKERGLAIAVAILTLFILTVIAFALGLVGIRNMNESTRSRMDNMAFQASRAGMNYTWDYINGILDSWGGYGTCAAPYSAPGQAACMALVYYGSPTPGTGTNSGSPYTATLSTGFYSATYYSNLLDINGYPPTSWIKVNDPNIGDIYVPPGYIAVVSIGDLEQGTSGFFEEFGQVKRRTLGMLAWNNTYNFALGDVSSFAVSGHLHTDSYNSDTGVYNCACGGPGCSCTSGTNTGSDGNVGTNSTCPNTANCTTSCGASDAFCIGGSAVINGTVVVGIGGQVQITGGGIDTGGWVQCNACVNTKPVTIPSGITPVYPAASCPANYSCTNATSGGGVNYVNVQDRTSGSMVTTGAGACTTAGNLLVPGAYGDLTINKNVYLEPGIYSFSSVDNTINANLYACYDPAGATIFPGQSKASPADEPTVIYLANPYTGTSPQLSLYHNSNALVVNISAPTTDTNKSEHLIIYGNSALNTFHFTPGGGSWTMALYAPDAVGTAVSGTGNDNIYGAIVIHILPSSFTGTIYFHADEALRRVFSLGNPRLVRAYQADY